MACEPVDLMMAGLVFERRRLGLAGFLCRACVSGWARAVRRRDPRAVRRAWVREALLWRRRRDAESRRRDRGCDGRWGHDAHGTGPA